MELGSCYFNYVWQIDVLLCVFYYFKFGVDEYGNGLCVMEYDQFYKNKLKNVVCIVFNWVWLYEIIEYVSGWIYLKYVMGVESGENLCDVLIDVMQECGGNDILYGVLKILMMDLGFVNILVMVRNFCCVLCICVIVYKFGVVWVIGQVENVWNFIECKFEVGLCFQFVVDLDELNVVVKIWCVWFNVVKKYFCYGMICLEVWMCICEYQLVKVFSVEVCCQLVIVELESCKVISKLCVSFQGIEYDVLVVFGVMIGEKLMIICNFW